MGLLQGDTNFFSYNNAHKSSMVKYALTSVERMGKKQASSF